MPGGSGRASGPTRPVPEGERSDSSRRLPTARSVALESARAVHAVSGGRSHNPLVDVGGAGYERRSPSRPAPRPQPVGTTGAPLRTATDAVRRLQLAITSLPN